MPLMFYETSYNPEKAQAEIQRVLLSMGARRVTLDYDPTERDIVGLSFRMETPAGDMEFQLPARIDRVFTTLKRQGVLKGIGGSGRRPDPARQRLHASSVAWRTLLEWIKLQLALVETDQAKADEIMLPYLVLNPGEDGQRVTVYEQFAAARQLPAGGTG